MVSIGFSTGTGKRRDRASQTETRNVPVNSIVFSPFQARRDFSKDELADLAQSIREHGVLQPILVRPFNKGFELVAGERRVRACKMIGMEFIPAVVRDMDDVEVAAAGLVENLQREDLNPLEEAEGYRRLIDEFGLTQEALAQKVGKSQSTIANKLRLLRLPEPIRDAISREIITERHARALLQVKNEKAQRDAFAQVVARGLNVQQTEAYLDEVAATVDQAVKPRKNGTARRIPVVKDIRIVLNSFKQAVLALRRAGLDAAIQQVDEGEQIRVVVTIGKRKTKAGRKTPDKGEQPTGTDPIS